ncbi:MAG: hypothetical protein K8Q99_04815 [Acholeplasmataceae bacterium]|nr:hypothetical protein [Acholeplasmataceae bacterium]
MTKIIHILKYYMIFIAMFFIIAAFDVFGSTEVNTINQILGFLLSVLPGVLLGVAVIVFWQKHQILSYLIAALATLFFIVFQMYHVVDSITIILIIWVPMMIFSILLFINFKKNKN